MTLQDKKNIFNLLTKGKFDNLSVMEMNEVLGILNRLRENIQLEEQGADLREKEVIQNLPEEAE